MNGFWGRTGAVVWKDIRAELRSREMVGTTVVFALLSLLTFSFAFDPTRPESAGMVPGVLWVTLFFAAILALGRSMAAERAGDALQGLLASPMEPEAFFLGKLLANLLFTAALQVVAVPVLVALFRLSPGPTWPWLVLVLALGTLGFVAAGTLLAALAINARASELLLPLLLLPVAVPVAIGAVEATAGILAGLPPAAWSGWLRLLAVYDILMLAVPQLLFRYVMEV